MNLVSNPKRGFKNLDLLVSALTLKLKRPFHCWYLHRIWMECIAKSFLSTCVRLRNAHLMYLLGFKQVKSAQILQKSLTS